MGWFSSTRRRGFGAYGGPPPATLPAFPAQTAFAPSPSVSTMSYGGPPPAFMPAPINGGTSCPPGYMWNLNTNGCQLTPAAGAIAVVPQAPVAVGPIGAPAPAPSQSALPGAPAPAGGSSVSVLVPGAAPAAGSGYGPILAGAAGGLLVGGPIGAVVGAGIGYYTAQKTAAPPPGAGS